MTEEILNYEHRLLQDRQKLLELTEQSKHSASPLIKDKINYFQTELMYMNNQLNILKAELEKNAHTTENPVTAVPVSTAQPIAEQAVKPAAAATQQQPPVPPHAPVQPSKQTKDKDYEKAIGKSLMGIFASVLIFISLILFSKLLLPYITETVKMIITYIVSFGFIAVGLYKLKKDKNNKFYLSLTGCGAGALYISLLLTNFYFNAIGDITLYALIILWAIFVCYLSRLKTALFQIIGQLGILIAIIFGIKLCIDYSDGVKFLVLIIFYALSSSIFYVAQFNRDFSKNIIFHIFNIINIALIFAACSDFSGLCEPALSIWHKTVVMILLAVHTVIIFLCSWSSSSASIGVVLPLYAILSAMLISIITENEYISGFGIYTAVMAISIAAEFKKANGAIGKNIIQAVMLLIAFISLYNTNFVTLSFCIPFITIPVLILGFFRSNNVYKYGAMTILAAYLLFADTNTTEKIIWGIIALIPMYLPLYNLKEHHTSTYNTILHILSILYMLTAVSGGLYKITDSNDITDSSIFIIICIFNLVMLRLNATSDTPKSDIIYKITNTIAMLFGLNLIDSTDNIILHLAVILVSLAIFMLNTKNLLDKYKNIFVGFYVGLKITVLIIVTLSSFDAANYIISVACFLFAIAAIIIGFRANYKSLRIYGLILSMLSVFKLIMIDIHYSNTLGNAVSFFVSGILCFAISMIYNYIDKKLTDKIDI